MKECKVHGMCEHYVFKNGKTVCKQCNINAVTIRRKNVKKILIEYKGGKCEICGYNKCDRALHFHHVNPKEKSFGISVSGHTKSLEVLKKEADKCILVCSNCHAEIHDKEFELISKERELIMSKRVKVTIMDKIKDKDNFLQDIHDKISKALICSKYNISKTALTKYLKNNNLWYDEVEYIEINKEDLISNLIKYRNFTKVGKIYNLSDNGLRKRCKKLNLPYTHKMLEEYIKGENFHS